MEEPYNKFMTKYLLMPENKFKKYFLRKVGKNEIQYYIKYLDKPSEFSNDRYLIVGVYKNFAKINKRTGIDYAYLSLQNISALFRHLENNIKVPNGML